MAKKKTDTTTDTKAPEEKIDYKEIHDKDIDEVVADVETEVGTNGEEKKDLPAASGEPPTEAKPEEKPLEIKKEDEGVDFDPKAFKDEVAKEIKETIVSSLSGKPAGEQKETMDEYDKFVKDTMEAKGRNPTWKEAMYFLKEEIKRDEMKAQEEQKKVEDQRKQADEQFEKQLNAQIDEELDEAYKSGKLTKIKDEKDPADRGMIERKSLFETMMVVNQQRVKEGKPIIYSVHRIINNYWTPPPKQPAGADAPVSAGRGNTGVENDETVKYEDIHKKSWRELLFGNK